jgi:dipeptidyl aminopeptidase/acylaminoacyl peptidase
LWQVSDGALLQTLSGHSREVTDVAFSPDGTLLASASADGTAKVWQVSDGAEVRTLMGHSNWVNSVSFSPDGTLLASASADNTIRLWQVWDGAELQTYDQEMGTGVLSIQFSPDGQLFACGRDDATVMVARNPFAQRTYSISGQVTLEDFSGDVTRVPVAVELRRNGNAVRQHALWLDASGCYTLRGVQPGTYDLAIKASHWLRAVVPGVTVTDSDVDGMDVWLLNGDIDGDNEVTLFDFGALVAAFGSMPGDGNWNPDADLDGDDEVTLFDFGILVRNFGAIGDE